MNKKIVLVIAIVCGLLAAVLTRLFVAAKDAEIAERKAAIDRRYGTMEVLCVVKDLPSSTVIEKKDLGLKTVPALGMRGQALTEDRLRDVVGKKLLLGHARGDVLFWSDIEGGDPSAKGLSADIKRQMRAMSVNVNAGASVSGMVRPNDHVDVIGTFAYSNDPKDVATVTILQNVLVLATGRETAKNRFVDGYGKDNYSLVTLEVTPREAEMLAFTEQMKGRLVLTLRNRSDTSYEKELPTVDFQKIKSEIEELNLKRQQKSSGSVFK